ncbi:hypothetical protein [Bradyrhizobium brasilense]|uniref:hypothetical protein n=1 Tax=Bradyrhizobium brasilense TaxID=1419277 RepID=UPI0015A01535|nr:hypothetical protein [Bradyrhizobium brasilense]
MLALTVTLAYALLGTGNSIVALSIGTIKAGIRRRLNMARKPLSATSACPS